MKFVSCANHISFDQTKKQFPSQRIRVKGGDHIRKKKVFEKNQNHYYCFEPVE